MPEDALGSPVDTVKTAETDKSEENESTVQTVETVGLTRLGRLKRLQRLYRLKISRLEPPKGAKDEVKRPEGPPARSGAPGALDFYYKYDKYKISRQVAPTAFQPTQSERTPPHGQRIILYSLEPPKKPLIFSTGLIWGAIDEDYMKVQNVQTIIFFRCDSISQLELITFEILAAERLRLMAFHNRLIIDCFANVVNILIWQFSTNDIKSEKYESITWKIHFQK